MLQRACNGSALASAPGLFGWERELLRDCPVSALGDIRPFPLSYKSPTAAARFVLGLKALHNFWYDMCAHAFGGALALEPTLFMAAWGSALCDAQLIWNHEDVAASAAALAAAS